MEAPYFINPDIEALPAASGEERTRIMRRIAACVGDEAALRAILGLDPAEFAAFYPDMLPPELSTEDTISSFINRFASEQAAEAPEIESIVCAPAVDYASMIEQNEPGDTVAGSDPDATSDAIDAFLQAVPAKTPARRKPQPATDHGATDGDANRKATDTTAESRPDLSEALFRLMVKNKNYTKALEIITELSLNNPKKSVYFAYQMRFLKKLIKNQENLPENKSKETAPNDN